MCLFNTKYNIYYRYLMAANVMSFYFCYIILYCIIVRVTIDFSEHAWQFKKLSDCVSMPYSILVYKT